jgi:pimeloyl-ACP methyl ester carboxylesterase
MLKTVRRRILPLVLALVLTFSFGGFAALAADDAPVVIVLPGIMGSELQAADGTKLWPPINTSDLDALAAKGSALGDDVNNLTQQQIEILLNLPEVKQLIEGIRLKLSALAYTDGASVPGISPVADGYGTLDTYKAFAEGLGTKYETVFFAYDWRAPNADSAKRLADLVESYKGRDVTLIGHSMGGIVITEYLRANPNADIANVITLGTPYLGSAAAADVLSNGLLGSPEYAGIINAIAPQLSDVVLNIAQSVPSIKELTPRETYTLPETSATWTAFYGTAKTDGDGTVSVESATNGGTIANTKGFNLGHNALVANAEVLYAIAAIIDGAAPEIPAIPTLPFVDVAPGAWYYGDVAFVAGLGVMGGSDSADTFKPQQTLTRAMMITILARLSGADTGGGETWYSKAVEWATQTGISDGANLDAAISREELVTMIYRYAVSIGKGPTGAWAVYVPFEDLDAVSDGAGEAVMWTYMNNIVTGKPGNLFDPQGLATRAEVAAIAHRLLEALAV